SYDELTRNLDGTIGTTDLRTPDLTRIDDTHVDWGREATMHPDVWLGIASGWVWQSTDGRRWSRHPSERRVSRAWYEEGHLLAFDGPELVNLDSDEVLGSFDIPISYLVDWFTRRDGRPVAVIERSFWSWTGSETREFVAEVDFIGSNPTFADDGTMFVLAKSDDTTELLEVAPDFSASRRLQAPDSLLGRSPTSISIDPANEHIFVAGDEGVWLFDRTTETWTQLFDQQFDDVESDGTWLWLTSNGALQRAC